MVQFAPLQVIATLFDTAVGAEGHVWKTPPTSAATLAGTCRDKLPEMATFSKTADASAEMDSKPNLHTLSCPMALASGELAKN